MRYLLAAAALFTAAPAAAQEIRGCSSVPAPMVAKTTDQAKLRADIACFAKAKAQADISTANRQKRLDQLAKPVVGDVEPPELGADFTKVPDAIPTANRAALIAPGWPVPKSGTPDGVGAFRFTCMAGQVSYDDPLVFPGQPGKSHLHQWYGNTAADAHSTYKSLRTTGDSTCVNTLNRSAYWMPAMLDGKGHVVRPDYITIYYKANPTGSAGCTAVATKGCTDLPRGLRYIFGKDMVTATASTGSAYFNCDGPTAKPGHYATITEAAASCPAGNRLGAIIEAPWCWDGKRLDSPNHRDHMADAKWQELPNGRVGRHCGPKHPYTVPAFTLAAWYSVDEARADSWYLSSDDMPGMGRMPAGSTMHADWFGAWDDQTLATWMRNCIDREASCNSGDLGNGTGMKQAGELSYRANPRLVPIPARP